MSILSPMCCSGMPAGYVCGFCSGPSCTPILTTNEQSDKLNGYTCILQFKSNPCKMDRRQCNKHAVECPAAGRKLVVWIFSMAAPYAAKHRNGLRGVLVG